VNVAEMHHLDWRLSAYSWPTGWGLWRGKWNCIRSNRRVGTETKECDAE
jgi:hypothetical protein